MKILFILELYYPNIGGIEKLFKSLAETLAGQGHEVTVITTRFRKDLPLRESLNGVKIKCLKFSSRFMFYRCYRIDCDLQRALSKGQSYKTSPF